MEELRKEEEVVILFAAQKKNLKEDDAWESLDELEELVNTAGARAAVKVLQRVDSINPGYYIGTGKVEELKELVALHGATGVVSDDELSPVQMRNLSLELGVKVMDRTLVILDIFAQRARSREGKLQVEIAQLKYQYSRLTGFGEMLSKQGGGIGTRGPGEKKLELDKRHIRTRMELLQAEIEEFEKHRQLLRTRRQKNNIPVVAIVGYTNAGKSTLLNTLTDAKVLEEDKLFATLDPTTRILELPGKQKLYLTDTVGFIRKLPHHLIEAFKSTLEEAKYADFIIHVVDVSNPQREKQMFVVYETLQELGVEDKKVVTLFNKQDKLQDEETIRDFKADYIVKTAIKTGQGLEELKEVLEKILTENQIYLERILDYQEAGQIQLIRKYGQLISEEYTDKGIEIKARVPQNIYGKIGGR